MAKFAHISDCHIGAFREKRLRELNLKSFETACNKIIDEGVDFVVISGDLFHANLPALESVRRVAVKLSELREASIPVYAVYGSHDYSPNATAMIDILTSSGLIRKVVEPEFVNGKLRLKYIIDKKTGAKICGLSGRSYTLELRYYEVLDREYLEKEEGFRIFVFHSAINELKPVAAAFMQGIPASLFPRNLGYYAGGHIHSHIVQKLNGLGTVGYPGPLFSSNFSPDLEETAKGERRGFLIIEFRNEVDNVRFVDNQIRDVEFREIDGDNRTAKEVESKLFTECKTLDPLNKIILIRLRGTLSAGKVSEIDVESARQLLIDKGSEFVFISRRNLSNKVIPTLLVRDESPSVIEDRILRDAINEFRVDTSMPEEIKKWVETKITGEGGFLLAKNLLSKLKTEKQPGETNDTFEERLLKESIPVLPRWDKK